MLKKIFILVVFVYSFTACDNQKQSDEISELKFKVDTTKLGKTTIDDKIGVKFRPPDGWNKVDSTLMKQMLGSIEMQSIESDSVSYTLHSVFVKQTEPGMLSVSKLEFNRAVKHPKKYYERSLDTKFGKAEMFRKGNFLKDGIKITQYLIQNRGNVNFKLLFNNSESQTIQFDYILSRESYSNQIRAIESSIGSINLIN